SPTSRIRVWSPAFRRFRSEARIGCRRSEGNRLKAGLQTRIREVRSASCPIEVVLVGCAAEVEPFEGVGQAEGGEGLPGASRSEVGVSLQDIVGAGPAIDQQF